MVTALAVLVLSLFSGCTASRPRPEQIPALLSPLQRDSLAQLPPYLVPPPAGSSPRQVRRWQKAQAANLARAGHAPASVKVKNSTVANGPGSTAVSTAKKSSTAAGTGATSSRIDKAKAPVAAGPGSVATDQRVEKSGSLPWWLLILGGLGCFVAGGIAHRKVSRLSWWPLLLAFCLLLPLASEASTPAPPRYSYKEARKVERRYNHVRRYYKRVNRRNTAELLRQQHRQTRELRRGPQ